MYKQGDGDARIAADCGDDPWRPATLSHAQILSGATSQVIPRAQTFAERLDTWREDASARLAALDITADELADAVARSDAKVAAGSCAPPAAIC